MKMVSQRPGAGAWATLVVIPLLYVVTFALWVFMAPAFAIGGRGVGPGQEFPLLMAMGCYLALLLVHVVLFLILRSEFVNLLFGLACLTMLLRAGASYSIYALSGFSAPAWPEMARIEYMAFPVMGILAVGIVHAMLPGVFQKWFLYAISAVLTFFAVFFLFASGVLLRWAIWGCMGAFGGSVLYFLVRLAAKLRRVDLEQVVFLAGSAIFLYFAASDALRYLGVGGRLVSLLFPFMSAGYFAENALLLLSFITATVFITATARKVREAGAEKYRLAAREMITESRLDFQREQYERLMESIESVRFMRHDLRHHLAVVSEYANTGNIAGIQGYMEGVETGLSSARGKVYCENHAVSAITAYYLNLAEGQGVETTVKLTVPSETGRVRDSDLCVIVGNFLENAVEACRNVAEGERFLRLFSYMQDDTLTITMENSFDGRAKERDGVLYSRKHEGEGVGLSSVRAVAAKYGGAARFESQGAMFLSSAYVQLDDVGES